MRKCILEIEDSFDMFKSAILCEDGQESELNAFVHPSRKTNAVLVFKAGKDGEIEEIVCSYYPHGDNNAEGYKIITNMEALDELEIHNCDKQKLKVNKQIIKADERLLITK